MDDSFTVGQQADIGTLLNAHNEHRIAPRRRLLENISKSRNASRTQLVKYGMVYKTRMKPN